MSSKVFRVFKPGLLTTIQDLGREGFQQYGMVVAGAMDSFSLQVANLLVGNKRGEAALEITSVGPELEVLNDAVVSICGANLSPTLDGANAPLWKSFEVKKGQILRFGAPKEGNYAYLAIAGGFNVPLVMESKSTYIGVNIGGLEGRALKVGDILHQGNSIWEQRKLLGRSLTPEDIPQYSSFYQARVILGPERDMFLEEGLNTFLTKKFTITQQMNRMGYRLSGPKIKHRNRADIISDAVTLGTIQVPADGEPIILLSDRQTTGGYSRIGTVISVDIPYVAQMIPGSQLSFKEVSLEEAQRLYVKKEKFLRTLSVASRLI